MSGEDNLDANQFYPIPSGASASPIATIPPTAVSPIAFSDSDFNDDSSFLDDFVPDWVGLRAVGCVNGGHCRRSGVPLESSRGRPAKSSCLRRCANLYYTVRQAYGLPSQLLAALWADVARGGGIVEAYAYAIDLATRVSSSTDSAQPSVSR